MLKRKHDHRRNRVQGFPKETVEKVVRLINWAEFKRRQAALNLRVSKKPFGLGWENAADSEV